MFCAEIAGQHIDWQTSPLCCSGEASLSSNAQLILRMLDDMRASREEQRASREEERAARLASERSAERPF